MIGGLCCFAGMGVIHKLGDRFHAQPLPLTLAAVFSAGVVSFLAAVLLHGHFSLAVPSTVILIAMPFGISAALALWFFQTGLRYGHIATSWLLINLSSAIPTLLSAIVYKEPFGFRKAAVLLLVIASLLLLWWDRRNQRSTPAPTTTGPA